MAVLNGLISSLHVLLSLPTLVICVLVSVASLTVYRLFLSPLAVFPGPKLAAATSWYEFYWNIITPGQFTFHLQELHDRYGKNRRLAG